MSFNNKKCLICKRPNNTVHWHVDSDTGSIWCYCVGKCQRGYSLHSYCHTAGVDLNDFLKGDFEFQEAASNEVSKLDWPNTFISLHDPRAKKGLDYVKSRGLEIKGDMYFDTESEAIVFPYYYGSIFVGAQTRLINPWLKKDGEQTKILTLPGTRLGLVFYNWNQDVFFTNIKAVIVCEGAFNTLSIQQALNNLYGGVTNNPFKAIATSGCGTTKHQIDKLKELKESGKKIIIAFDSDEPGLKGLTKMIREGVATHYCLTKDTEIDWNDILKKNGHKYLAEFVLKNIKDIDAI